MKRYVSTTSNSASGESIEMIQLARSIGAQIVHGVPHDGLLVYIVNLNMRAGTEDLRALAERKHRRSGPNVIVVGVCRGWEETEQWRPYFEVLRQVADVVFVHHPAQIPYLRQYGIEAVLKPINEERYRGAVQPQPRTVLYTGFLWEEKDLATFVETALELPEHQFTIHVGQPLETSSTLPANCRLHGEFIPQQRYLEYLAGFDTIWIPRKRSPWVYAGRSGLSAVASGRPALLTDVAVNDIVPADVAIKYPAQLPPAELAQLIRARQAPDPDKVGQFLDSISPEAVWGHIERQLQQRSLLAA